MNRLSYLVSAVVLCSIPAHAELVHHWTLDETTSTQGATITDVVGGKNGTVSGTGITPAVGVMDGALHFAGNANDHVTIAGFETAGMKNITVTFWMNMDVGTIDSLANGDYQRIFSSNDGFEAIVQADGSADTGKLGNNFYKRGGKAGYVLSQDLLAEGEWIHVAMTSSLTTAGGDGLMTIYLNGLPDNTRTGAAIHDWTGPGEMMIGFRPGISNQAQHYSGLLDDIRIYNTILTDEEILALVPQPSVDVTGFTKAGDNLIISWDGMLGQGYNVLTSPDLTQSSALALLDPFTNIPGVTGPMAVTAAVNEADAAVNYGVEFFKIVLPPVFEDDFENGLNGWTVSTDVGATDWQLGMPNYTNPGGDAFTSVLSGENAWATGLTTAYAASDHTFLRSPLIDLSGLPRATLTFYDVRDIEQENASSGFDHGYVNILDAAGTTLGSNLLDAFGTSTEWTRRVVDLSAYTNQQIRIEFELISDSLQFSDQFGWAIDDVAVGADAAPEPPPLPPDPIDAVVNNLVLVSTQPGTLDRMSITDGMTINLDAMGVANTNVNIRAETDMPVGSVRFELTGSTTHGQTESVAPYYLFGDNSGVAEDGTLEPGAHTLAVTPYELGGTGGGTGATLTVNFTIVADGPP